MSDAPDAASWAEIDRLLDAALELPPEARDGYVRENASSPGIATFVLDLLDRESRLGSFLELPPAFGSLLFDEVAQPSPARHALNVGDVVGAWRLVRELGHGGMAIVWLAERADAAWAQQVALKFVRPSLDGPLLRERFGREQRILARLQHPRIARLLDGGVDHDRHYLVLEFVEGIAITDWCAQQSASLRMRLRLLRQVCDAVAFAHARLIVHRDIKPSNILVDAAGDAHLLDFGIAKILAGEDEASTALTAIGGRAMTPSYAAPEQIDGRPLSVATDVYSLGVLLYEILCGHSPYRLAHPGAAALEEAVLNQEPMPASRCADAAQAERCATSLRRLRRELRGDIDRILATALEKDPDRRYASVEAFAQDIDRHLDGRPIHARRTSFGYRAGKFVRRHAVGLAVGVALVVAILGGIAGTLWQARLAQIAALRAHAEAAEATAVRDLLTGLFQTADPDVARGRDPTASELLDAGARRTQRELAEQPVLKARLLGVIADLFLKLGHYRESQDLYAQALEISEPSSPEAELDRMKLRFGHAEASMLSGGLSEALKEFDELDGALAGKTTSGAPELQARVQVEQGEVLRRQGHYTESRTKLDAALALLSDPTAANSDTYLTALQRSADLEFSSGHFENAERQFRDLLARLIARHGEEHTEVARAYHDIGVSLGQLGRLDEAEVSLRRALELRRRLLGENHPAVAYSHANLAAILRLRQRLDDAESHYKLSLEINSRALGEDSMEVARDYNGLAALAAARRDFERARELFSKAFAGYEKVLGPKHPDVGMALMNQAIMERRLGRYAEAKDNLLRALAIFGASLPDDHYFIALARYGSGMVSLANGDAAEATEYLQRSVPAMEKSMGAGHVDVARAKAAWSLALAMRGDLQEAARVADEVSLPASDPRARADIGYLRGRALYLAGTADACADLDQAWRSRTELDGASDGGALEAELYLGACLHSKDERSARERILHAAPLILANATSAPSVRHDATRLMRGEYRL